MDEQRTSNVRVYNATYCAVNPTGAANEIERLQQRVAELTKANADLALLLSQPPTADRICDDELKITYEHGQPYGIRDRGGYLFFFSKISKYSGQEERYRDEVAQAYRLADFLLRSLQRVAVTKESSQVGCEGNDGLLRVHSEAETCDVCQTDYCDRCGASMQHKPDCPESEQAAQRAKSEREVFEIVHRGGLSHETEERHKPECSAVAGSVYCDCGEDERLQKLSESETDG